MSFRIQTGTGTFPPTGAPPPTPKAGPAQTVPPFGPRLPDGLQNLHSPPADGGDFSAIASVSATGQALDRHYLKLAGEPVLPSAALPAVLAEQHARYALDSTLAVINGIAADLLAHSQAVSASGNAEQRAALVVTLKRFLAQAQSTMVGLVAATRAELPGTPSADMQKLLTFASHGLWQGLDALGGRLRSAFDRQVMTAEGPVEPSPAQREQACNRLVAEQTQEFNRQMEAIQLSSVKRPGFDPAALVGVVAMRAELATALARTASHAAALPGDARDPGRAPPSSPASSVASSSAGELAGFDPLGDLQDRDDVDFDGDGFDREHDHDFGDRDDAMDVDDPQT